MKTAKKIRESEGQGANERMARAIVTAGGDLGRANLPDDVLAKVTEIVYPRVDSLHVPAYAVDEAMFRLFAKMPNLKRIVIGADAPWFPEQYFSRARAEEVVIAQNAVRSKLFLDASGIKRVVVTAGDPAKAVPTNYCFARTSVESVVFEEGVKFVPLGMFYSCPRLESVVMPGSVRYVDKFAFRKCEALQNVTMPSSDFVAHQRAFAECPALKEADLRRCDCREESFVQSGLTSVTLERPVVGESAFESCEGLRSVQFGPEVTQVDDNAFKGCSALEAVDLPEGLACVGRTAFRNCRRLKTVCLRNQRADFLAANNGVYPFRGCSGVQTVYLGWDANPNTYRAILIDLGLSESQIGPRTGRDGTTMTFSLNQADRRMAEIGAALAKVGVCTECRGSQLCARFNGGIGLGQIQAVIDAVQMAGPDVGVAFADRNMVSLQQMSDVSQIEAVVFIFGKERAA